jgi:hypothetical protein
MSTNKRISGNYTIQTLNAGDQVTVTTSNVVVNGNLQVSGNIAGNTTLSVPNAIVSGNVTANLFVGNGSALTGIVAVANIGIASQLINGTTTLDIPISGGNIFGNINGVSNVFIFRDSGINIAGYVSSNTVSALENITGGNILTSGLITATGNVTGGNILTSGLITATSAITSAANITGGNILTSGLITATGNVTGGNILTSGLITATGNVTGGNILTSGLITATGAITGSSLSVSTGNVTCGNILNANGNGVGNIGNSSTYFNTVFAQATTALYADLAECYMADADYEPGTVVMFGGTAEVTVCNKDSCAEIAGVISTNPAYKMNAGLDSEHVATVALIGRVPVRVQGPVRAGAMMVSAGNGRARAEVNPAMGTVIGKAVQSFLGEYGTIEIVVGRL